MKRRTPSTAAVTVVAAVVLAALTGCSSDSGDDSSGASGSSTPAAETEPETDTEPETEPEAEPETESASPSPSPTGPCAGGTCEVEVAVGDVLEVPDTYGLGPIEITAITGDRVELSAPLTGSGYSVAGCAGGGSASSNGGGGVGLSCGVGPAATINEAMSLEIVEIRDASALLRIEPAA